MTELSAGRIPEISVLMCVRNGEKFLAEAIESILHQSFDAFEFIIVNDGSTDGTAKILDDYADRDARIKTVKISGSGLPVALNIGLKSVTAPFVARMDADDIALPQRLSKQMEYLCAHEEVSVLGTGAVIIDENGKGRNTKVMPHTPAMVRNTLPHRCCLINPSVMIRRSALLAASGYNLAYKVAEDYDLWLRISEVSELANLTEPLIKLRKHEAQVTKTKSRNITQNRVSAVMEHFLRKYNVSIDGPPDDEACTANKILAVYEMQPSPRELRAINANAIRFFRMAELDQEMTMKLDTAIITASNLHEHLKHSLYKTGL